jgi:hypothetical protein
LINDIIGEVKSWYGTCPARLIRQVDRGVVPEPDLAGLGSAPGMLDHVLSKIEPHAN